MKNYTKENDPNRSKFKRLFKKNIKVSFRII